MTNPKNMLRRRCEIFVLCHPEGIYALVATAEASTCKDPYPDKVGIRRGGQDDWKNKTKLRGLIPNSKFRIPSSKSLIIWVIHNN